MRNRILLSDCIKGMKSLPNDSIPMNLTSPPYDELRDLSGNTMDDPKFRKIDEELFRITMPGGVVAWVVGDQIGMDRGYTGTGLRQVAYFQSLGFRLHDVVVITKSGSRFPRTVRYSLSPEFAFVFAKGRPRSINLICDRPNRQPGRRQHFVRRRADGMIEKARGGGSVGEWGVRGHVWNYSVARGQNTPDLYAHGHPALMDEAMVDDLILSWSRPGDLILDPMCGAATTCKMALLNDRNYLGFEIHEPFHRLAIRRVNDAHGEYRDDLDNWLSIGQIHRREPLRSFGGYEVIYADPPWPYKPWGRKTGGMDAEDHYRTMSMEKFIALPVGDLAARDSVLLLWTTGPFLDEAIRTVEAWGFEHKTVAFNWVKTRAGGVLHTGLGYHTRSNSEFCVLATRGNGLPRVRKDIHQVVISKVSRHSEKPKAVRHRIEALYGPRRRVELFAPTEAPGWDALGDAIDGRDIGDAVEARLTEHRMRPLRLMN
jgi:N6-adenosine-specific RNA methylase IME4/DNA modification methylase